MDAAGQGMLDPARLLAHPAAGRGFGGVGGFGDPSWSWWLIPGDPRSAGQVPAAKGGIWSALWNLRDLGIRSPWKAQGYLPTGNGEDKGDLRGAGGRKSDVPCW